MKTAEEILKITGWELANALPGSTYIIAIKAMREYARQACIDQRILCADEYGCDEDSLPIFNKILNAPLPELK